MFGSIAMAFILISLTYIVFIMVFMDNGGAFMAGLLGAVITVVDMRSCHLAKLIIGYYFIYFLPWDVCFYLLLHFVFLGIFSHVIEGVEPSKKSFFYNQ